MTGQIEDYEVLQVIGTGSFGSCYKVRNKLSGRIYVWKAIDYGKMTEEKKQVGYKHPTYKTHQNQWVFYTIGSSYYLDAMLKHKNILIS